MSKIMRWLNVSGSGQHRLAVLFLMLIAGVVVMTAGYWFMVLEPQLKVNARSNINALAQSNAYLIADLLTGDELEIEPSHLDLVLDEILVLTEQVSGQPFFRYIALELDYDVVSVVPSSISEKRGRAGCSNCIVTSIPLFDRNTKELMGTAHFTANDTFYRELRDLVRYRLLQFTAMLLALLAMTWLLIAGMIRKIRDDEKVLRNLFEAAPLPMVLVRPESDQVLRANAAAIDYFESSEDDIPHVHSSDFYVNSADREKVLQALSRYGQIDQYELEMKTAKGTHRWVSCSAKMVDYCGDNSAMVGFSDVSTFKQTQHELLRARDAAQAADRAKSEFLAMMSHEIRTPLNGIFGVVQLLQRSELNEKQRRYLDSIMTSGDVLLALLNDLLDLSRIEAGKFELNMDDFELQKQLNSLIVSLSEGAREKGLTLQLEISPDVPDRVHGDSIRLRQVLLNLVGNALKFTEQGHVTVTVELVQSTSTAVELAFSVQDTGIGIDEEAQQQLFNNFSQSDSSISRRYGGSGLGLAISKRLVNAMGGDITLKSQLGEGSIFSFRVWFKYAESLDNAAEEEHRTSALLESLSVLVAEDVPMNRYVVRALLEAEGHKVLEASDGKEAIALLQKNDIDVVLMDLHMPGMDGIAATREIRSLADKAKARVPIVALTANILQEERDSCRSAGMDGFVVKPFTIDKLLHELSETLKTAED